MNIVIGGHSLCTLGGVERICSDLASAMAERGHKVFLFLTENPPSIPLYKLHPLINIVIYSHNGRRGHLANFREQILSCNPDVCISLASDRRHFPWCVALQDTGIPLIISEHSAPHAIAANILTPSERLAIMQAADGIHLLLPSYINSLPVALHSRVRNIQNAVNLPQIVPIDREYKCIISMGRLSHEKQNHLIIDAFFLLHKDFPNWRVEIWGDGPEEGRLKERINKCNLGKSIFLRGPTKEPEQCFARADIVCMASCGEGFPGAVAEGMMAGLPVVGFADCSGTNEMIQHGITGYLAQDMDAKSLAECLRMLMQDENLRKSMGKAGQDVAQNYAPQKVFDLWEDFLLEISQKKNATALQTKQVKDSLNAVLNVGLAKSMNVLVGKGDMARALIFQIPWLKRKIHPFYTWFKCKFLQ